MRSGSLIYSRSHSCKLNVQPHYPRSFLIVLGLEGMNHENEVAGFVSTREGYGVLRML